MARARSVLSWLITAWRRDFRSIGSFQGNNLFVVGVVALFFNDPGLFAALTAFIALVLFIPLSADPLRVVPRDRLAVWPLTAGERRWLRIVSPWFNPITWLIAALALWKRVTLGLAGLAAGVFAIGFVLPSLPAARRGLWRRLPDFPGRWNQLVRKNLREAFSTLDFWCSAVVSVFALGFRLAGLLPRDALLPITILVTLAFSTYTQTLFGLDGEGGMTRYRLLPLTGWEILAAKDGPFLLVSIVLTLPLAPFAGLAAALTALAIGHYASVTRHSDQVRWRFASGASFGMSIFQVVAMCAAAATVHSIPAVMLACAAIYAWSLWSCGRMLEREEA